MDKQTHILIDGCIRGNALMQKSFYYQYYPVLMRICIRYAPNREDAEQWVHDGFIKIFAALPVYQYAGSFEGWLKKIMVRLCIDKLRTESTRKFETENSTKNYDEIPEDIQHVSNSFLEKADAEGLLLIINSLPDKQRVVFNLIVFEGYTHKEIAELLQITENHSYALLHQARKHIKECLTKTGKKQKHEY